METNYLCVKEEDGKITIVTRVKRKGEWFPVGSTTITQEQAIKLHEDLTELIFDHYFV